MNSGQWSLVQEVFHEAIDRSADLRLDWLRSRCGGDELAIAQVLRMLEEDRDGAPLLEADLAATASGLIDLPREALAQEGVPRQLFGPYRLVRLLGEGGMGVVYLAEREDLGSQAAVKILRDASLSPMRRQRFLIEQKTLAQLNHPSIARLYDADTLEDGTPFIVMEYVDGVALTSYAEQHTSSIEKRIELFRSICEATRYAHAQGIIHRDLKPSNILVTGNGAVKLVDFGIAKQLQIDQAQANSTTTSLRILTPAYAAPEQIRGEPAGIQADVYSLGVILYELLAGNLPHDVSGRSPAEVERDILETEPKPPSTAGKIRENRAAKLSNSSWSELDTICLTAMHKDLQRRYLSAEALIRDLDHYLKGEPLEARPDSLSYRLHKFAGRNRRALLLTAALASIAVIAGIFVAIRLSRARQETAAQAERTKHIQEFMLNLFNGGDKQSGPSEDLRVVTLLDRGVQQARALDRDPETQAQLYQTLAGIYQNLGNTDRAEPLLHSAMEVRTRLDGIQSPQVADTMTATGLLRLDEGKPAEAEKLTRDALALDQRLLPPTDPAIAKAMSALARVLVDAGSYDKAAPLLKNAIALQSGRGQEPDLALTLAELAELNYYQANYPGAEALYRQSLDIEKRLYGETNPRVADDYLDLGEIQHDQGHEKESEGLFRRALEIKKAWYGENSPETAYCMMALGQSLVFQKRYDDAFPLIQRSVEVQENTLGKSHPKVALAYSQIGTLELRRKHFDAAADYFNRSLQINRSVYGNRHIMVGVSLLNLAEAYLEHDQYPRAEVSFREALDVFRQTVPADHPDIAITDLKLGDALVLEGKYREAEAPLVEGYKLSQKSPSVSARLGGPARKNLATVYQHLSRPDKAAEYADATTVASNGNSAAPR